MIAHFAQKKVFHPYSLVYILLTSLLLLYSTVNYAKQIAFSFDDGLNPTANFQANSINQALLNQLKTSNIQAMIFPSYSKIGDFQGKQLVRIWGEHGHLIGNHSAFHQNLNHPDVSAHDYIKSIQINESIFKDLPNYTYRFRFPYLKEGDSIQKRDQVRTWLQKNHYLPSNVSIDASDWFYNLKYLELIQAQQPEKLALLKRAYLAHLLDRAHYYDTLSVQLLKRSPKHILLLHTNAINAAYLTDIIGAFNSESWSFININEALNDPIYNLYSTNLPAGESIIWSLAKAKGFLNLRYPAEDSPYEIENLRQHQLID